MAPCFSSLAASARGSLLRSPLSRQCLPLPVQGGSVRSQRTHSLRTPAPHLQSNLSRCQPGQEQVQLQGGNSPGEVWTLRASSASVAAPGAQAPYETGNKEEEEEEDLQPQTTIGREISVAGIGLHSGLQFQATLRPAPAGHGRVFYLPAEHVEGTAEAGPTRYIAVSATVENAVESRLCTVLRSPPTPAVGTISAQDTVASQGSGDTGTPEHAWPVSERQSGGYEAHQAQQAHHAQQAHQDTREAREPAAPGATTVHPGTPGAHQGQPEARGAGGAVQGASRAGEVRTAEHLLSALEGLGVGNVEVQVDCLERREGESGLTWHELPLLDGSAAPWAEILSTQAGIVAAPEGVARAGPPEEPQARTESGCERGTPTESKSESEASATGREVGVRTQRRRRSRLPPATAQARTDLWHRAVAALTELGRDPRNSTVRGNSTAESTACGSENPDTHQRQSLEGSGAAQCQEAVQALAEAAVVSVVEKDSLVAAFPSPVPILTCGIHFPQLPVVGVQWVQWSPYSSPHAAAFPYPHVDVLPHEYSSSIAPARTFAIAEQVAQLQAAGLIKGGSLDNALVCSQEGGWLNPPLRFPNEPCRHKLLDLIGDLSLLAHRGHAGVPCAHIVAYKASHALHSRFANQLKAHLIES